MSTRYGEVLVVTGTGNNGNTISAELYHPSTMIPAGLQSIAVSPTNPSVGVGGALQLIATGTFSNGTETLQSATWSSSDTTVAAVSNDPGNSGNVYGVALGSATIRACVVSVCDSTTVTISPPPSITNPSPNAGPVGTSVTISGAHFGDTQGGSSVTFNGTPADPAQTTWSDTSITTLVPTGATTGNIVVTVGGAPSNGVLFMVTIAYANGYLYRQAIYLDHTKVANSDQTNFPILISGVYSNLATVANGGFAESSNGYDIIFSQDPEGASKLDHEIDSYDPVTGTVNFWVRIPTLSHTVDTVLYMFYGNSAVTTDQSNKTGVWDSNYVGVWHLPNGTTLTGTDSTSNGNNLTNNGSMAAAAGTIDGAASFNGANAYLSHSNTGQFDLNAWTWDGWIKPAWVSGAPSANPCIFGLRDTAGARISLHLVSNYGSIDSWNGLNIVSWFPAISQNNWYHAVFTYNNGALALYLNGSLVSSQTQTQGSGTGRQFDIGYSTSSTEYWNGLIDEVRFSSTARSPDWIATEYADESSPSTFYAVEEQVTAGSVPTIQSLSPSGGSAGVLVTIQGGGFQPAQGSSTVTFNGVPATPTSWNDATIVVPVPAGATTGNVVVTVNGIASNGVLFTLATPYTSGYLYRRVISLDHTKVANSDQTDFPILISGVYSELATLAYGGYVQSSSGYDIIFSQDPEGASKLDHEIDSYDPVTGTVNFWVRIPTLSHTADTVVYMFYGNASVTVSQENKAGVWRNGYAAVWHFGSSASLNTSDSTANANNGTNHGVAPAAGKFGGAGSFDGTGNTYLRIPSSNSFKPTAAITQEAWVNMAGATSWPDIFSLDYRADGSWNPPYAAYALNFWNNTLEPRLDLTLNGNQIDTWGPNSIAPGQWTHVVGTYDGSNLVVYANGTPVVTTAQTGPIDYGTSQDLDIGTRSPYTSAEAVNGLIDEARISTVARSADWIATEYANETSPAAFYALEGQVTANSAPAIQLVSPAAAGPGILVTIQGGGFQATQGNSTVTFNGFTATPASWNDAAIVVPVPTTATTGNLLVTVNGVASNAVPFTVPPPNIASLSPSSGTESTMVTITGTYFGIPLATSTVTFNGVPAAPSAWTDTEIDVRVPFAAATGNVVVTVNGAASNAAPFTVLPAVGTTALSDSMGRTTNYGYQDIDGRRFVTGISGSGCASCGGRGNSAFTLDTLGNVLASTDALNNTISNTYDSMGNVLTKSQQLNANTTLTWSYTYNSFQEVLTATDPAGNVTTNVYDAQGNLLSTTTPPPSGSGSGFTTNFQYNTLSELTQVTDPKGNHSTLAYTPVGLVASITDAQSNTTTFTYDGRGNRLTSVDALNHTTTYTYDAMNRLTVITAPDLSTTQFGYDYRGRRTSVTDANGKTTTYQYDDADRLLAVTDAAQNVTTYGYDTENNMVAITDAANHETQFSYDDLGRVTQVTFPSTLSEGYTYDAMNNLLSKTDRKGQTINYGYDALYRLTSKTYPDQTAVNYTYDPVSRMTQVTDPTGTYSFTYDNLGRLVGTGTQYSFLSSALNNSYSYDAASNRTSLTDAAGYTSSYSYDSLNRLTSLTDSTTGQFGFGYDALGRRTSLTRPNGVNTSYSYDTLSRLLGVLHNGGALPGSASYTYDAAGNRLTKTAVQEASPNPISVLSQYSYDNIYELTQAVVNGSVAEGYTYDAVGNRLTSAGPVTYNNNTSNELTSTSAATYAYDNNGSTISKTTTAGMTSYTWDFENRLASVTLPGAGGTVNFKYDPLGRRVEKIAPSSGTTIYAYDGDRVTEELGGGGNLLAYYTQGAGIDEPLATAGTGGTYFYHADGLGSITSLTGVSGQLAASYAYDSFGSLTASTGTITNPFQYTSRELDSETGVYYYRARYYDSSTGRFMSEDPSGPNQGPNLYAYVYNSPVGSVDPSGLYTIDKSCQGKCLSLGGGGPNNPNQLPQQVSLEDLIRQGTDDACSKTYTITNLKLRRCVEKSCNQGKIKCDCGSNEGGFDNKIPLLTNRTAHVCFKDWPSWTDPSYAATWYGQAAIHEWAHGCGWNHGGGGGIPKDPGRGH